MGHTRSTQTKGVWVWGEPQKLPPSAKTLQDSAGGQNASIVYLDTEGFESTGKADAYDDRIFALSTLISAVLVYNLPETVRESDIQKLSFAVELAEGFYADVQVHAYFCAPGLALASSYPLFLLVIFVLAQADLCAAAFVIVLKVAVDCQAFGTHLQKETGIRLISGLICRGD